MSTFELITTLLQGLKVTTITTVLGIILGFFISFLVGFGRLSNYRFVRFLSTLYTEIFRGTSLLVQLFWIYFALPILGLRLPAMATAILALGLNAGAYGSEVVRSSILAVPAGQTEASIALNMTSWQKIKLVILPQALVMMLPGFGNLQIELLKGTALVSLITLADLTYQGMILNTSTLRTAEIYTLLLIIYFIISWPLTRGISYLEKRLSVWRC